MRGEQETGTGPSFTIVCVSDDLEIKYFVVRVKNPRTSLNTEGVISLMNIIFGFKVFNLGQIYDNGEERSYTACNKYPCEGSHLKT